MRAIRVRTWVEVVGSVINNLLQSSLKRKKNLSRHLLDESKAAVRGRKVADPAVYKNIAEFNEIRTAHIGSLEQTNHEAKSRVQWNARNIPRATLRECGEASSCQEANPMYEETDDSCLPARSCQDGYPMYKETDDSLSEGELESTWPCSIQKYCRIQRNREFVPVQWGSRGRLTMKRCGRGGSSGSVKANDAATQPTGKSLTLGWRE